MNTPADSERSISLGRQLFTMTWPMLFGVLSLLSFQLIDSAFIGQLGVLPLAAQGFTLPVQMVVIGVQVGLGIAITAIVSRALGEDRLNYARQLSGLSLALGGVGLAVISVLLWLLRVPLLSIMGAEANIFPVIDAYWPWWLVSVWFGALVYLLSSICRANGNTMLPGFLMMAVSGINLVLDPIFIFTLGLGIQGAAIATIVAFALGLLFMAPKVIKAEWISFDWQDMDIKLSLKRISSIMMPAMASQLLPPISAMMATKVLAGFGAAAVAAWALASRYEFFSIVAVLALTMSMPPMVGRLLGAKNFSEIDKLMRIAIKFILAFQLLVAVLTLLFADLFSGLMTSEDNVESVLSSFLVLVPFSLGPLGVCILVVSISNALAKPQNALLISAARLFVFFLPCLWVGAQMGGIQGVFIGAFIGNCLSGVAAWISYKRLMAQMSHPEE